MLVFSVHFLYYLVLVIVGYLVYKFACKKNVQNIPQIETTNTIQIEKGYLMQDHNGDQVSNLTITKLA